MIESIIGTALAFTLGMAIVNTLKGLYNSRKHEYVILKKIDLFIFGW